MKSFILILTMFLASCSIGQQKPRVITKIKTVEVKPVHVRSSQRILECVERMIQQDVDAEMAMKICEQAIRPKKSK